MSDPIQLELRVPKGTDVKKLIESFDGELKKHSADFDVKESRKVSPMGMTTPDIILSVAISVGSSAAVHVYRDQIETAAKSAGKLLSTDVRVLFGSNKKSIDEDE
jgi:hypothetical protein